MVRQVTLTWSNEPISLRIKGNAVLAKEEEDLAFRAARFGVVVEEVVQVSKENNFGVSSVYKGNFVAEEAGKTGAPWL